VEEEDLVIKVDTLGNARKGKGKLPGQFAFEGSIGMEFKEVLCLL
jgi:hypothetical protein